MDTDIQHVTKSIFPADSKLSQLMATPEEFISVPSLRDHAHRSIPCHVPTPGFYVVPKSIFDVSADSYVNTINCVGVMGAGIALEFKKRYPKMFDHYKEQCDQHTIKPGDCYTYFDEEHHIFILNLAVKDDWRHWSTLEWIEHSVKSLKLAILENDIKSVNLPLLGGKNGRRGPYGKVPGMTPPPERAELEPLMKDRLEPFAKKFGIEISLCIPEDAPKKQEPTLDEFFTS